MRSAIELVNVSKIYRRYGGKQFATLKSALLQRSIVRDLQPSKTFPALTDVSFTVPKGSTYGVIGRNGSGKSTALKLVAGITKPTSGRVTVDGRISALMRLGFAVAIHVDPDVLLVDEVLAVGDEGFTHKCLDKFAEFRRKGKTFLLVTHSLSLVERFCDEAVWLDG